MINARCYKKSNCYGCFLENYSIDVDMNFDKSDAKITTHNPLGEEWHIQNDYARIELSEFEQALKEAKMIIDKAYMSYFIQKDILKEKEEFRRDDVHEDWSETEVEEID